MLPEICFFNNAKCLSSWFSCFNFHVSSIIYRAETRLMNVALILYLSCHVPEGSTVYTLLCNFGKAQPQLS